MMPNSNIDIRMPGRAAVLVCLFAALAAARPAPAAPPIWTIEGIDNTIRIAGSMHYLRDSDHPLPAALVRAYVDADVLVVEYDSRREGVPVRPVTLIGRMPWTGRVKPAGPLRRNLTTPEFTDLRRLAEGYGFDINQLDRMKPWFAGMYVVETQLSEAGFESELGVDNFLLSRAREEGKPVMGLETAADQRELFNEIPLPEQIDFLVESLRNAPRIGTAMDRLVSHWRDGNLEWLERNLLRDLKANPGEYQRFSIDRNRQWVKSIERLVDDGRDYLVVVGVVHLLAEESLLMLLRERGFRVSPWPEGTVAGG